MGSRTSFALATSALLAACAPKAPAEAPQTAAAQTTAPEPQAPAGNANLPPPEIQSVVRASPAFRACYEAGLRRDETLHGRVVLSFVVSAEDGTVSESEVDTTSDLPDPIVLQCMQGELKKLRFPKPAGGKSRVVYPMAFSPADVPPPAARPPHQKSPDGHGRLEPEVIQRVVRAEFSRFRLCYEGGLRRDPNLQGRVATRFVIAEDGTVREATIYRESDLPDQAVLLCVALEFKKLRFPKPEGGIITVVYPISFSPAD